MSVLYSDNDGYFVSHQLFIAKLYDTVLVKTENSMSFYEHFFHVHNPFVRDKQRVNTEVENTSARRKRKRLIFEVILKYLVKKKLLFNCLYMNQGAPIFSL